MAASKFHDPDTAPIAMAPPMAAWAQKLTSSPDGIKNAIVGNVFVHSLVSTKTLSQSQDFASRRWRYSGKGVGDANTVTGFPPSDPRQKTRASIFWMDAGPSIAPVAVDVDIAMRPTKLESRRALAMIVHRSGWEGFK